MKLKQCTEVAAPSCYICSGLWNSDFCCCLMPFTLEVLILDWNISLVSKYVFIDGLSELSRLTPETFWAKDFFHIFILKWEWTSIINVMPPANFLSPSPEVNVERMNIYWNHTKLLVEISSVCKLKVNKRGQLLFNKIHFQPCVFLQKWVKLRGR